MNYKVIPIQKLTGFDTLTYSAPKNSKFYTGQLVYIPLKNTSIPGIIYEPDFNKTSYNLRDIIGLFDTKPILTLNQIIFCKWITDNYISSMSEVCYQLIPTRFRKVLKKDIKNSFMPSLNHEPPAEKSTIKKTSSEYVQGDMKIRFLKYKKIIQKSNGQTLIISPDINIIPESIMDILVDIYIHDTSSPKSEFESWQKIYKTQPKTILGSHKSLLLPIKKISNIILDQENHPQIQYDQKPYYDLRIATKNLAEQINSNLYIGSNFPSLLTYKEFNIKNLSSKKLAHITLLPTDKYTPIEKQNLAFQTEEIINKNLGLKQPIVLLILRKGFAQAIICKSCMTILKCPKCNNNTRLIESQKLYCTKCNNKILPPNKCNICKSLHLEIIGLGQLGIEDYLKRIYPTAKISTLENKKRFDIAIITPRKLSQIGRVKDLIILNPESILSSPSYNIKEKLHQVIYSTRTICDNLFIQTQVPKNEFWQNIKEPHKFLKNELLDRKKYELPPVKKVIVIQGPSFKLLNIKKELIEIATILGPTPYQADSKQHRLIIKSNYSNFTRVSKILKKYKSAGIRYKIDPIDL
ncbi:hypothetical protein ACFL14_00655 [Patescibacteria group bacterium]